MWTDPDEITNLSGAAGSQQFFKMTVPAGQRRVQFSLSGGTGNADLYVRAGARPTTTVFDCLSARKDNNEKCTTNNPVAGDWFVMIQGAADYSGVSLLGQLR